MSVQDPRIEALDSYFRSAPAGLVVEQIANAVIATPSLSAAHARLFFNLFGQLYSPFERGVGGPGGWRFVPSPELQMGGDRLRPELAGWRHNKLPEAPSHNIIFTPPDFVCLLLVPGALDLVHDIRLSAYSRHGCAWAWVVDPENQMLEVYHLEGHVKPRSTFGGDLPERVIPFADCEFSLGALWNW